MSKRTLIGPEWTLSNQKRVFDNVGIVAISPFLLATGFATATGLMIADGHNPFFRQERYGLDMEPFEIYKLRTMPVGTSETPSEGAIDSRATPFGKFARYTHFDEIPQAINIFMGNLSLVGPRPLILADVEQTLDLLSPKEQRDWVNARSTARPGFASEYQLKLHRTNYEVIDRRERAMDDIEYANTATSKKDIRILLACGVTGIRGLIRPYHKEKEAKQYNSWEGEQLLASVAEDFGIVLNESDRSYWRAAFYAARLSDKIIGYGSVEAKEYLMRLKNGLPVEGIPISEVTKFRKTIQSVSVSKQKVLFDGFAKMFDLAIKRREEKSLPELAIINEEEEENGFADLMELSIEEVDDTEKRLQFNKWLHNLSGSSYIADNTLVLKSLLATGIDTASATQRQSGKTFSV